MIEKLRTLAKMQGLDDRIGRYRMLQTELPEQLKDIIDSVDQATANLLAVETERATLSKLQRALETDIKQHTDHINKYSSQLAEIKTNKEYKALNSEIAYLRTKISDVESQLLELMDQDTELKGRAEQCKAELEKVEIRKREKEGDLRAQINSLDAKIEETRNKRNDLARTLPEAIIKQYGKLIKNKNNQAVAYNKSGACGGCGIVIRPQIRIEMEQRKKINFCENCGRILMNGFDDLEEVL